MTEVAPARRRGALQDKLNAFIDLFFWCMERGVVVGLIGYAARTLSSKPLEYLYWAAMVMVILGASLKSRPVLFAGLDRDQKAARTSAESLSLAPRSVGPVAVGVVLAAVIQWFVTHMADKAVH